MTFSKNSEKFACKSIISFQKLMNCLVFSQGCQFSQKEYVPVTFKKEISEIPQICGNPEVESEIGGRLSQRKNPPSVLR